MTPRRLWPLAADLACVLVLAIGGRNSHEPDEQVWVVLVIAWPFALAAALAHAGLALRGRPTQRAWPDGAVVLVTTYVVGMALRGLSGRGLAPAFLVVAGLVLAAGVLGWRLLARLVTRRDVGGRP